MPQNCREQLRLPHIPVDYAGGREKLPRSKPEIKHRYKKFT